MPGEWNLVFEFVHNKNCLRVEVCRDAHVRSSARKSICRQRTERQRNLIYDASSTVCQAKNKKKMARKRSDALEKGFDSKMRAGKNNKTGNSSPKRPSSCMGTFPRRPAQPKTWYFSSWGDFSASTVPFQFAPFRPTADGLLEDMRSYEKVLVIQKS